MSEWERLTLEVRHLAARLGFRGDVTVVLQCSDRGDMHKLRYDYISTVLPQTRDPHTPLAELKINDLALRIEHA